MQYKIKEISDITGISIRMLRHYHKIGLLTPKTKSESGYRLYDEQDIEKLLHILYLKELDFSLEEIKNIVSNPSLDFKKTLKSQEELLTKKKERLEAIINALKKTTSYPKESFTIQREIFTAFDMAEIERNKEKFESEFGAKFDEETMNECKTNHSNFTKEDWTIVMSKADEILSGISRFMSKKPSDPDVQNLIKRYRDFINENMWNCTADRFKTLADLYVTDIEYRDYIIKYHKDLPKFLREAIYIYCNLLVND